MNYGSSDCPDCRQTTSGNCGKHGNVVVIEGGSTLPLLAERQYCYDRIAALIAERDAALQRAEQAEAALAAVERQTQAEIVRVVAIDRSRLPGVAQPIDWCVGLSLGDLKE